MARLEDKFKARASGYPVPIGLSPLTSSGLQTEIPEILLTQIQPDPNQPRRDLGDLTELKASISSVGVIQPILVRIVGYEAYEVIAGERRFTAARELGLERIPALVRTLEEHQRLEVQLIENLHRKDLNPLEEAESYRRLMDEFQMWQEDLGKRLGRSQSSISESLRLLSLSEEVKRSYRTSDTASISKSVLLEIARQPTDEKQRELWSLAKRGELTVRKAKSLKPSARQEMNEIASQSGTGFRYPIQTELAMVTVRFEQPCASQEEIIEALEQALEVEKARLDPDFLYPLKRSS